MPYRIPALEVLSEKESADLYNAINGEPPLPCVLIATNYLDQCLASLLKKHLIDGGTTEELLDPTKNGALGSFQTRAEMAYCLGFIHKAVFSNLCLIAQIRNRFAHNHLALNFDDTEIVRLCSELTFPRNVRGVRVDETGSHPDAGNPFAYCIGARDKFSTVVVLTSSRLLLTGLSVQQRERETGGW